MKFEKKFMKMENVNEFYKKLRIMKRIQKWKNYKQKKASKNGRTEDQTG